MKLYYYKDEHGNFGDDLNPWFWDHYLGDVLDDDANKDIVVGIGTLINHRVPTTPVKHVMGSGVGYGAMPAGDIGKWHFHFVRGPLSCEKLGLDKDRYVTDPAVLIPTLLPLEEASKRYPVAFMPHCDSDRLGDWQRICEQAGVHYISPRNHYTEVFKAIRQTEFLITEAMHGAILADAYRTPWLGVKCYPHFSDFKWSDWMQSMQISADIVSLPPHYTGPMGLSASDALKLSLKRGLKSMGLYSEQWSPLPHKASSKAETDHIVSRLAELKHSKSYLSDTQVLASKQQQMAERIDQVKRSVLRP